MKINVLQTALRLIQGAIIGLGAVLPGISGGVLSVIFGIYKPMMELLSNPFSNFKSHVPMLFPVFVGGGIGFLGVANVLAFFLETYPNQSVCLFVGLITGMLPSLFKEAGAQGRNVFSYLSMAVCMCVIFGVLIGMRRMQFDITPNFFWYLFCGFCLALSLIAPGMSFSTLLMPLGLYTPFVDGIGSFSLPVLVPGGIGALVTIVCLAKAVNTLFERRYSAAFHGILGVVIAATVMTVPLSGFSTLSAGAVNAAFIAAGILAAQGLERFNRRVVVE